MTREEIAKLLGGYATGTLTAEERRALFEAALEDQSLFEELVHEQPLREVLEDPAARGQLLAALGDTGRPWWAAWWRPAAALAAAAAVAIGIFVVRTKPAAEPAPIVAMVKNQPVLREQAAAIPEEKPLPPPERKAAKVRPQQPPATVKEAELPPPPPPKTAPAPVPMMATAMAAAESAAAAVAPQAVPPGAPSGAKALFYQVADRGQVTTESAAGASMGAAGGQTFRTETMRPRISPAMGVPAAAHLGLRYTVLRQTEADAFAEADPASLQAGDTVRFRFEANDLGYLEVMEGRRTVVTTQLQRNRAFETPGWKTDTAGERIFVVRFSRQPFGLSIPVANEIRDGLARAATDQSSEATPREGTYVVDKSDQTASQTVTFPLRLVFR